MPNTREDIKRNWAGLSQAIENANINMDRAAASDRNPELDELQFVLRTFFASQLKKQPGTVITLGDTELHYDTNKTRFLDSQAKDTVWAEDLFLTAGFGMLGIQPVYVRQGRFADNAQGYEEAPFVVPEAISVAKLVNSSRGHWESTDCSNNRVRSNAGGGNCGLYSAAQEVASVWPQITHWLNGRTAAPFKSTQADLSKAKKSNQMDREMSQTDQTIKAQLNSYTLSQLETIYLNLVRRDPKNEYLKSSISEKRKTGGLPEDVRSKLYPLTLGQKIQPKDLSDRHLKPALINIITKYVTVFNESAQQYLTKPAPMYVAAPKEQPAPIYVAPKQQPAAPAYAPPKPTYAMPKPALAPVTAPAIKTESRYVTITKLLEKANLKMDALQDIVTEERPHMMNQVNRDKREELHYVLASEAHHDEKLYLRLTDMLSPAAPQSKPQQPTVIAPAYAAQLPKIQEQSKREVPQVGTTAYVTTLWTQMRNYFSPPQPIASCAVEARQQSQQEQNVQPSIRVRY